MEKYNGMSRRAAFFAALFFALLLAPSLGTKAETLEISDEKAIAALIADTWEEDYFGSVTIDRESGEVKKDGETEKFKEIFGVGYAGAKAAVASADTEALTEYLEEAPAASVQEAGEDAESPEDADAPVYEATEADGVITVTAPYQTKRVVLDALTDEDYGAAACYIDKEEEETIFQFATEAATETAYQEILADYGAENCFVDEVFLLSDAAQGKVSAQSVSSWGVSYMGMDSLKSQSKALGYAQQVTVAVIDTGIDRENEMFAGRTISSASYSMIGNSGNVQDVFGHGTHVCGIIAQATPANVEFLVIKVSDSDGRSSLLAIKAALSYAVSRKADVINLSMGFPGRAASSVTYLDSTIKKAYQKGIPICCAAGNDGIDVRYCYPACNKYTIAVTALNPDGSFASYSDRGSRIDFCAPGTGIASAKLGGGLVAYSGTSMAAPHLTAAIAYIKMMNPGLTVKEVYKVLKRYSMDLGSSGKDSYYGWGCPQLSSLFLKGISVGTKTSAVGTPRLKKAKNTAEGVRLSWTKGKKAKKYQIFRKTGNGSYQKIATVSASKRVYVDRKAKQGKIYTYKIKAVKGKTGAASNEKSCCRMKKTAFVRVKRTGKKLRLSWKKLGKVSGYEIQYGISKNKAKKCVYTVMGNRKKTVISLEKKRRVFVRIRAYKDVGGQRYYSGWSAWKRSR